MANYKKFIIIFALTLCLFAISFEKPEVSANTENPWQSKVYKNKSG